MSRVNAHKPVAQAFVPYTHSSIVIFDGQMYRVCGHYIAPYSSPFDPPEREEFEITSIKPVMRTHTDDEHVVEFELAGQLGADVLRELERLAIAKMQDQRRDE